MSIFTHVLHLEYLLYKFKFAKSDEEKEKIWKEILKVLKKTKKDLRIARSLILRDYELQVLGGVGEETLKLNLNEETLRRLGEINDGEEVKEQSGEGEKDGEKS